VRLAAIIALAVLSASSGAAEPSAAQREFEAATAREAAGDFAGAADALLALARARPDDPFAADAIFEAAVIAEEHLSDPARALALYREVLERYPQSRLGRRARGRVEFLASSLRTGEAPLREYQEILNGFARRPPAESIARMEKLVAAHPEFALADRAIYWLGSTLAGEHRDDEAEARFREVERRFPESAWAPRAKKARGDLAIRRGHPLEARRIFAELAASASDPLTRAAAAEGLKNARTALRRTIELGLAIAFLAAFAGYHLLALRRRRWWRVPGELYYYGPVAALFSLAAATENRSVGWATFGIAAGGGAVVWLSSALSAARLAEGPMPVGERVLRIVAASLAVTAVMLLAVQVTGLTDLVVETLRSGPER
jgi:tetratricopeptide (TPR) repeat protein